MWQPSWHVPQTSISIDGPCCPTLPHHLDARLPNWAVSHVIVTRVGVASVGCQRLLPLCQSVATCLRPCTETVLAHTICSVKGHLTSPITCCCHQSHAAVPCCRLAKAAATLSERGNLLASMHWSLPRPTSKAEQQMSRHLEVGRGGGQASRHGRQACSIGCSVCKCLAAGCFAARCLNVCKAIIMGRRCCSALVCSRH
jgi:hypothetical protein